jgi:hypothetical protein
MQANPSWPPASPSSNGHTRHRRRLRRYNLLVVAIPMRLVAQTTSVIEGTVLDTLSFSLQGNTRKRGAE